MPPAKPVILILGPTAGGKTRLAIDLAHQLPGGAEIISSDSMQIYRGMDIGTAKPTPQERAEAPHHLLDIADPADDSFSVDRWLELAHEKIAEIRARDHVPIIVGGTNLYIQAFLGGMMEGPPPDVTLRAKLNELEPSELRQWLQRVDPASAQRIHPNDRKRTVRAIEVFESTGKRLSELQTQWEESTARITTETQRTQKENQKSSSPRSLRLCGETTIILGLDYPVETINRRINARVKAMIDAGFVDEVRRLHASGSLGRNAREALGYKQVIEHLEGQCTLEEAIEQIKIRTRRYAKQQRTWLRRFKGYPHSVWIDAAPLMADELALAALRELKPLIFLPLEANRP